jgi:hypothetical protein
MFSIKSVVLLALLASVSANRDLLQGEFGLFQFFSSFEECVADVFPLSSSLLFFSIQEGLVMPLSRA